MWLKATTLGRPKIYRFSPTKLQRVNPGRITGGALVAAAGANKTSSALSTTNGRVAGSYAGAVRGPTSSTGKAANVAGNGIYSQVMQ